MPKQTNPSPTYPQFPGDAMPVVFGVPFPAVGVVYVGAAGNVTVVTAQGSTVTFTGLLAGSVIPVQVRQVNAAGTTIAVAAMVAIY